MNKQTNPKDTLTNIPNLQRVTGRPSGWMLRGVGVTTPGRNYTLWMRNFLCRLSKGQKVWGKVSARSQLPFCQLNSLKGSGKKSLPIASWLWPEQKKIIFPPSFTPTVMLSCTNKAWTWNMYLLGFFVEILVRAPVFSTSLQWEV